MRIFGLGSLPEYNDTLGTISGWDTTHERWKVKCDFDGKTKALLEKNMEVQAADAGASGDAGAGGAAADGGSVTPAPNQAAPADAIGPGVMVYLTGLNSTPELNGMTGVVTKWDDALSRWRVKMNDDGKTKALKTDNLRPASGGA